MERLNFAFFEAFSRLDRLCCDIYQTDGGVAAYIAEMGAVSATSSASVPGWHRDLEQLYRYQTVRNALAQSNDALHEPLCGEDDIGWLEAFYQRILDRQDPLAQLQLKGYRADDDARQRLNKHKEVIEHPLVRGNHDRYVNGLLVVGLILGAVLVTCLICLLLFGKFALNI